ncbi:MAG: hypothetical protein U0746_13840 [Gemmataceae bacterium]
MSISTNPHGCNLAAGRSRQVRRHGPRRDAGPTSPSRFEVRFLAALLDSPDGTATTDDATDDAELVGQRPRAGATSAQRLPPRPPGHYRARPHGRRHSRLRPVDLARHRTPVGVWWLIDRPAAERRLAVLRAALAAADALAEPTLF